MARIDAIRERLNTLRVLMSVTLGVLVVLIGALTHRYDVQKVDTLFWLGVVAGIVVLMMTATIFFQIRKLTAEIEEL